MFDQTQTIAWACLAVTLVLGASLAVPARAETVLSVQEARAASVGTDIVTEGVVTVPPGSFTTRELWIADPSGAAGIQVFGYSVDLTSIGEVKIGDVVRVEGVRDEYRGKSYVKVASASDVRVVGHGTAVSPAPIGTGEIGEGCEGRLVTATGRIASVDGPSWIMDDGSGPVEAYCYFPTGIDPAALGLAPGRAVRVTGVVGQYDETAPYTSGYQIQPRDASDVCFVAPPELVSRSPPDPVVVMEEGETRVFSATFQGEATTVQWLVDGAPAQTGSTFSYQAGRAGRHNVTARAENIGGRTDVSWTVEVEKREAEGGPTWLVPAIVLGVAFLAIAAVVVVALLRRVGGDGAPSGEKGAAAGLARPTGQTPGAFAPSPGPGSSPSPSQEAPTEFEAARSPQSGKAAPPKTRRVVRFVDGHSYLVEGEDLRTAVRVFKEGIKQGRNGLCITRSNPKHLTSRFGIRKAMVYWLTETGGGPDRIPPVLEKLITHIEMFAEENDGGIILLDGLEYLISNRGFDPVSKFLQTLVDELSETRSILLVPVNPGTMEEHSIRFLEREMDFVRAGEQEMKVAPFRAKRK